MLRVFLRELGHLMLQKFIRVVVALGLIILLHQLAHEFRVDRFIAEVSVLPVEAQQGGGGARHRAHVQAGGIVPAHKVLPQGQVPVLRDDGENGENIVSVLFRDRDQLHPDAGIPQVIVEIDAVSIHRLLVQRVRDHQEQVELRIEALLQAVAGRAMLHRVLLGLPVAVDPLPVLQEADVHQLPQLFKDEAVFAGVAKLLRDHVFLAQAHIGIGHDAVLDVFRGQPVVPPGQDGVVGRVPDQGAQLVDIHIGVVLQADGAGSAAARIAEDDALILEGRPLRELGGIEGEAVRLGEIIDGLIMVIVVPSPGIGLLHLRSRHHAGSRRGGEFRCVGVRPRFFAVRAVGLRLEGLIPRSDIDRDLVRVADGDISDSVHHAGNDGGGPRRSAAGPGRQHVPHLRRVCGAERHIPAAEINVIVVCVQKEVILVAQLPKDLLEVLRRFPVGRFRHDVGLLPGRGGCAGLGCFRGLRRFRRLRSLRRRGGLRISRGGRGLRLLIRIHQHHQENETDHKPEKDAEKDQQELSADGFFRLFVFIHVIIFLLKQYRHIVYHR